MARRLREAKPSEAAPRDGSVEGLSFKDCYRTPPQIVSSISELIDEEGPFSELSLDGVVDIGAGDGRLGKKAAETIFHHLGDDEIRIPVLGCERRNLRVVPTEEERKFCDYKTINTDFRNLTPEGVLRALNLHARKRPPNIVFVSNPPFSIALDFIEQVVSWFKETEPRYFGLGSQAWFLLRLGFLGSDRRWSFMRENVPFRLVVISPRPSFEPDPDDPEPKYGTDNSEYGWFCWMPRGMGFIPNAATKHGEWTRLEFIKCEREGKR